MQSTQAPSTYTPGASPDPELQTLIRGERLRLLYASEVQLALSSGVCAAAVGLLLYRTAPDNGGWAALVWVITCLCMSLLRLVHWRAYQRCQDPSSERWLWSLSLVSFVQSSCWGVVSWLMPVDNMVTSAVMAATLIGASAVSTFNLQAHWAPNWATNFALLVPPAVALLVMRGDIYGVFASLGMLMMLGIMIYEGRRSELRITELLTLRFSTDRIAQERAEALQMAEEHSKVKDQFLATMSHEMRTPLHGILGVARLLRERAHQNSPAESEQNLALIERTGEHLLSLINDVLDFSRIRAGHLHVEHAPFEVNALLGDVLGLLRVTALEKGLTLDTHIDLPQPCWVEGDVSHVRQILHNLVGNAIKFTDTGGVTLTAARASAQPGSPVVIHVVDTGCGIPATHLPRIFDAFHQVDGSFGRRHDGTGLGLTISREMARAMGGDLSAQSTEGVGSTFTLTLPLPATAAPAGTTPTAVAADTPQPVPVCRVDTPPLRVLLAEDNPVNALLAEAMLANLGAQVTHVGDGQAALEVLCRRHGDFDVVLMDCQMPGMDGLTATRHLRVWEQAQRARRMPVVALTANALEGDRTRCMAAGMDEHLAKPFRQEELTEVLRGHVTA